MDADLGSPNSNLVGSIDIYMYIDIESRERVNDIHTRPLYTNNEIRNCGSLIGCRRVGESRYTQREPAASF